MELYVSPHGNDRWSGSLADPSADGTDGPFATLTRARDCVRELKRTGRLDGPVTVWLRGGRYLLAAPLEFGPEDTAPVTYAAWRDEQPVLDGGRRLTGWRTETVHGRAAWVLDLPGLRPHSLFVNGVRAPRAAFPKEGFHWIEDAPGTPMTAALFDGDDTFIAREGDLQPFHNLEDVEVVLYHFWIEERLPMAAFDPATRTVKLRWRSTFCLKDDFKPQYARYRVENVFEALSEPGEWYHDRASGRLYYLPKPGEDPETTEVVAPVPTQLLRLIGEPELNRHVEFLRFRGLTFQHADWRQPLGRFDANSHDAGGVMANSYQGAFLVPGVIELVGARHCAIENCRVRHVGWYAVELGDGCHGNRIVGCDFGDLGAGGVKLNGADAAGPRARRTGDNHVTDNHIHAAGRVFHSACGILCRHSYGNHFSHNHIHDLYYTGISVGWVWGYGENVARDNRIEKNHIHDLGQGLLSDMGGVYTLGVQPGTVIRGNLIHDVRRHNYGGWAIYPDEGTSHVVIEHNVCYGTDSQVFHQHYGRENTLRNNVFAFGAEATVTLSRPVADHLALTMERNLILSDGQPAFTAGSAVRLAERSLASDLNLYWDLSGAAPTFKGHRDGQAATLSLAEWQALGCDAHSVVADPGCRDPRGGDFTLPDDSPAFALGFEPIDLSDVGPRPTEARP